MRFHEVRLLNLDREKLEHPGNTLSKIVLSMLVTVSDEPRVPRHMGHWHKSSMGHFVVHSE